MADAKRNPKQPKKSTSRKTSPKKTTNKKPSPSTIVESYRQIIDRIGKYDSDFIELKEACEGKRHEFYLANQEGLLKKTNNIWDRIDIVRRRLKSDEEIATRIIDSCNRDEISEDKYEELAKLGDSILESFDEIEEKYKSAKEELDGYIVENAVTDYGKKIDDLKARLRANITDVNGNLPDNKKVVNTYTRIMSRLDDVRSIINKETSDKVKVAFDKCDILVNEFINKHQTDLKNLGEAMVGKVGAEKRLERIIDKATKIREAIYGKGGFIFRQIQGAVDSAFEYRDKVDEALGEQLASDDYATAIKACEAYAEAVNPSCDRLEELMDTLIFSLKSQKLIDPRIFEEEEDDKDYRNLLKKEIEKYLSDNEDSINACMKEANNDIEKARKSLLGRLHYAVMDLYEVIKVADDDSVTKADYNSFKNIIRRAYHDITGDKNSLSPAIDSLVVQLEILTNKIYAKDQEKQR